MHWLCRKSRILVLLGLILLVHLIMLSGCDREKPVINDITTLPEGGVVEIGGEITLSAEGKIENPGKLHLTYKWVLTAGTITSVSDETPTAVYKAPYENGRQVITLQALYRGEKVAEKSITIRVGNTEISTQTSEEQQTTPTRAEQTSLSQWPILKAPVDVMAYYIPSGWMGDGEQGEKYITIEVASIEDPHSSPTCTKITYNIGPDGWGGIYYQYPDKNWGDLPGYRIQGAKKVTFWARGLKGDEVVEFKAGGMGWNPKPGEPERPYKDSFFVALGMVTLAKTWNKYEIDLSGQDLSRVIGAFVWAAAKAANPKGHLTFYLDDIRYE